MHYESCNDITGFAYVAAFEILESFQADNYVDFVASWFSSNPSKEHTFMKLMESNYTMDTEIRTLWVYYIWILLRDRWLPILRI